MHPILTVPSVLNREASEVYNMVLRNKSNKKRGAIQDVPESRSSLYHSNESYREFHFDSSNRIQWRSIRSLQHDLEEQSESNKRGNPKSTWKPFFSLLSTWSPKCHWLGRTLREFSLWFSTGSPILKFTPNLMILEKKVSWAYLSTKRTQLLL